MAEFSRRNLLSNAAAWAGGIAALAAAKPGAAAMQRVDVNPQSPLGIAILNRCGPDSAHADIKARLQARLAADASLQTLTETCPICGCSVTVSR
jgi:hypothetical protein